ncbi:hypothetical protein HLB03_13080, partial [Acidianus sp. DSM 29099]|nr:hypothetical protein [Acidianus sp. RZ1]
RKYFYLLIGNSEFIGYVMYFLFIFGIIMGIYISLYALFVTGLILRLAEVVEGIGLIMFALSLLAF